MILVPEATSLEPTLLIPEKQPNVSQELTEDGYRNRECTQFEKVYTRKFPNRGVESNTSPASHESEPTPESENGKQSSDLELPIALRKEKRTCAKYPTSAYVSYSKLLLRSLLFL